METSADRGRASVGAAGVAVLAVLALLGIVLVAPTSTAAPTGPVVSLGDQSGLERDLVNGSVFLPVFLSEPADEPVVVSFYTVDGTAVAGEDYVRWGTPAVPRTVTIPAGLLQGTINVAILPDDLVEPDETFDVVISGVSGAGATIGRGTGTATIVDADELFGPNPVLTVSDVSVVEGDAGQRRAQFQIHLSRPSASGVTLSYATVPGTAVPGVDYVDKLPGTVVFVPGQISRTVDVLVESNTEVDDDRAFFLEVSVIGGSPVEEISMTATATILDDDEAATTTTTGSTSSSTTTSSTTTTTAPPADPVVSDWDALVAPGPAPATVAMGWSVSDPEGGSLTCRIDGAGDGVFEIVVEPCPGVGSRNVSLPAAGSVSSRLRVESSSGGVTEAIRSLSVGTDPVETYVVVLRGLGGMPSAQADAFVAAANRLQSIIVRGVPNLTGVPSRPSCLPESSPNLPGTIDDVIIDVTIEPIDGVGGVLGSAGPTCVRSGSFLPAHGVMRFDSADVAALISAGQFSQVVLHEMAHVLGFGTIWGLKSLISGAGGSNPVFTGLRSIAEWSVLGGVGNVPLENTGGGGTADSHWRESVFGTELLTGFLNSGFNPFSRLSVASFADLGYQVNLAAADPYSLPGMMASARHGGPVPELYVQRPPIGTL